MTGLASPVSAPASAATAAIPFKPASPADASAMGGSWIAVIVVLIVASVAATLLRRKLGAWPKRAGDSLVNVVESRRIGERMRLSVIRYRDRELLIAHGDQSAVVLVDATAAQADGPRP